MIFANMNNAEAINKNDIINFNNKFSRFTKNYTLLVIYHIPTKHKMDHTFTHHDNIDFLELYTLSSSTGVNFTNSRDNEYINNIINKTYNFNLETFTEKKEI